MSKKSEEALNALIKPIRNWLKGNNKRNALVILSEPRAKTHLVLATNTTGNDMIPDMGLIVGMEPQLTDVLLMIHDFAMDIEPATPHEPDWEDTIDFTASSSGRPDPEDDTPAENSYSRQAVGAPSVNQQSVCDGESVGQGDNSYERRGCESYRALAQAQPISR